MNGRAGEPMLSAEATAAFFAKSNGCGAQHPLADSAETTASGHPVTVTDYDGCPPGGGVFQVTLGGGGHEWPPGAVTTFGQVIRSAERATLGELAWAAFQGALEP